MAEDQLRLVATVVDQFTGPLGALRRGIAGVSETTKQSTTAWKKDWDGARGEVSKFEGAIRGVMPVLSGLGVSGIGVSLSLAGMASAVGGFTKETRNLSLLSRDLGLTIDQLRAFQALGERFGVSSDTMAGALKNFSGQLYELQNHRQLFQELRAMNLTGMAEDIARAANPQQAIEKAMEGLRKIPNDEVRRRVSRMLFGTDDIGLIASNLTGAIKGVFAEVNESIGKMDKQTEEASKNFQKHVSRITEAWERGKLKVLGPLAEGLADTLDHGWGDEKDKLGYWRKERDRYDQVLKGLPADSWKRPMYEGKRDAANDEIRKLEDSIRKGTREGLKDALRDQSGGATIQPQNFNAPLGGGSLIQKAAWGGLGGGPLGGAGGGFGGPGGGGAATGGGSGSHPSGGGSGGRSSSSRSSGDGGQFTAAPPEVAGKYRPQRNLTDRDLSDQVVNTIAGEARLRSQGGADAVINNMFNRLGTKGWGPSRDLQDVARAPGQYAGYRRATEAEAAFIRDRIRAIASGGVPDNTNGSNSFRASWYRGPWWRRHGQFGKDIAGNTFAYDPSIRNGPYAPYPKPKDGGGDAGAVAGDADLFKQYRAERERLAREGKAPAEAEDDGVTFEHWKRLRAAKGRGADAGQTMMRRFYGDGAPTAPGGKGSMRIELVGFPQGTKTKASMEDLFKDTKVQQTRSQMDMS